MLNLTQIRLEEARKINSDIRQASMTDFFDENANIIEFDIEQIQQEYNNRIDIELMNELRIQRNKKLVECDWRMVSDYQQSDQELWLLYRQELRDLPQNIVSGIIAKPVISENGEFVFNEWPTEPNL